MVDPQQFKKQLLGLMFCFDATTKERWANFRVCCEQDAATLLHSPQIRDWETGVMDVCRRYFAENDSFEAPTFKHLIKDIVALDKDGVIRFANTERVPPIQISVVNPEKPCEGIWFGATPLNHMLENINLESNKYQTSSPQRPGLDWMKSYIRPSKSAENFQDNRGRVL